MAAQGPIDHTVDDPEALGSCDRGCGPTFLEPCTYCGVTFCEACYAIGYRYLFDCMCGWRVACKAIHSQTSYEGCRYWSCVRTTVMQPHTTIIATQDGRNYVCFTNDTVRRRRLELLGGIYPGNGVQDEITIAENSSSEQATDEVNDKSDKERDNQGSGEHWENSITDSVQAELNPGERSEPGTCCPVCEGWITDASSIEYARPKTGDDEPILGESKPVSYGPPSA